MASIEIITNAWPVRDVLPLLLTDRSAKKNIIFATESYADRGVDYGAKNQITEQVLSFAGCCIIQPRVLKDTEEQLLRTRKKAEVFTPAWVCCLMNNYSDEEWFGRSDVFGQLKDPEWTPTEGPIEMPKQKRWQAYVDSRRLEITCGEAPYLVSRYDMATGELIPIKDRIGILDRKLRVVNENAVTEEEWLKWTLRAFQAVYGYEYQGDNLLVARINLLFTYIDYMQERWNRKPTKKELEEVAKVISWNLWQMDGLKGSIPLGALYEQYHQLTIFDIFGMEDSARENEPEEYIPCRVFDWRGQNKSIEFNAFQERRNGSMKFDFIIGNPPYQDETIGDNKGFAPPIYDKFIDAACEVADKVELIHPARFLFNAGSTPKAWNEKMLNNKHFKILEYESNSSKYFSTASIMGGIVISYYDQQKDFGKIGVFSPFSELRTIREKVVSHESYRSIQEIIWIQTRFNLNTLYEDHPETKDGIGSDGKDSRFEKNIFKKVPLFTEAPTYEDDIRTLGISEARKREWRYIQKKYVDDSQENLMTYKVIMSVSNGAAGNLGDTPVRIIGESVLGEPGDGYTRSFIGIGKFSRKEEGINCQQYLKTKFARVMIGIMKTTQMLNPDVWKCVPVQDFSATSDIDWSQSVAGIDRQLYAKYGLSDDEITFIETHVKEME